LYDSLIVLYKNVCQKLDRGIKIEEVAKDEFKPMVGYCKIKNDLSYEITDKVTADIEKFVNDYKSESSNLEFSTKNIKINKKSTLESIEESTYENFGWIINKLPFDNKKNNFYLFVLIVFLAIYYILFKRK
ncbi:hypothetical protein HOK68_05175, partial [Candidatus Woesearchaeota archaeon]|nr:hypothetical protein [Candidatus Woesearchaeota archaeon]